MEYSIAAVTLARALEQAKLAESELLWRRVGEAERSFQESRDRGDVAWLERAARNWVEAAADAAARDGARTYLQEQLQQQLQRDGFRWEQVWNLSEEDILSGRPPKR